MDQFTGMDILNRDQIRQAGGGLECLCGNDSIHSLRENITEGFSLISLNEMDAAALLDRMDTKYVIKPDQIPGLLEDLKQDYRLLSINGIAPLKYRTLYFDTPDFKLYRMHHTGCRSRYKIRCREYLDTHVSFLEVKRKTSGGRTVKDRRMLDHPLRGMNLEIKEWLNGVFPYGSYNLIPMLWNTFTRCTLVSRHHPERVTIDVNLVFYAPFQSIYLDGMVVVEVKRASASQFSPFICRMDKRGIRRQGISKYHLGVSILYNRVNRVPKRRGMLCFDIKPGDLNHGRCQQANDGFHEANWHRNPCGACHYSS